MHNSQVSHLHYFTFTKAKFIKCIPIFTPFHPVSSDEDNDGIENILTLSSPGFLGSSQPGGALCVPPIHNFFVIGRIMMKLGKLVKCYKLYLSMGFWWVNWL